MKIFLSLLLLFFLGCNKPDQHPELKDGIFLDLSARAADQEAELLKLGDKIAKQEQSVISENREFYKKGLQNKLADLKKAKNKGEQELKYLKIRLDSRRIFVKRGYFKARESGKPFETTKEFELYKKISVQRANLMRKSNIPEAQPADPINEEVSENPTHEEE